MRRVTNILAIRPTAGFGPDLYGDLWIDGQRLADRLPDGMASRTCIQARRLGYEIRAAFMPEPGSERRRLIYECSHCAGVNNVTCRIDLDGDYVVWRDFAIERDSEHQRTELPAREALSSTLEFRFARAAYEVAVEAAMRESASW